jgi:hypothetical protein
MASCPIIGEDTESEMDEADATFLQYGYSSEPNLLSSLTQVVATRQATDGCRVHFLDMQIAPTYPAVRITTNKRKWVDSRDTVDLIKANLAPQLPPYHTRTTTSRPPSGNAPSFP